MRRSGASKPDAALRTPEDLPVTVDADPMLEAKRIRDRRIQRQGVVGSLPRPVLQVDMERVVAVSIGRQLEQVGPAIAGGQVSAAFRTVTEREHQGLDRLRERRRRAAETE